MHRVRLVGPPPRQVDFEKICNSLIWLRDYICDIADRLQTSADRSEFPTAQALARQIETILNLLPNYNKKVRVHLVQIVADLQQYLPKTIDSELEKLKTIATPWLASSAGLAIANKCEEIIGNLQHFRKTYRLSTTGISSPLDQQQFEKICQSLIWLRDYIQTRAPDLNTLINETLQMLPQNQYWETQYKDFVADLQNNLPTTIDDHLRTLQKQCSTQKSSTATEIIIEKSGQLIADLQAFRKTWQHPAQGCNIKGIGIMPRIMPSCINPYFVHTGVEFPYYNQVSYQGDDKNAQAQKEAADLNKYTLRRGSDYRKEFSDLIAMENTKTPNYELPNAAEICSWMKLFDEQTGRVKPDDLDHFRRRLDMYFRSKNWFFGNLSDRQKLQRKLAKVATDVYERELGYGDITKLFSDFRERKQDKKYLDLAHTTVRRIVRKLLKPGGVKELQQFMTAGTDSMMRRRQSEFEDLWGFMTENEKEAVYPLLRDVFTNDEQVMRMTVNYKNLAGKADTIQTTMRRRGQRPQTPPEDPEEGGDGYDSDEAHNA